MSGQDYGAQARTEALRASPPIFAWPVLDRLTRVQRLRELHMRHHFEDDKLGFGVSVPW